MSLALGAKENTDHSGLFLNWTERASSYAGSLESEPRLDSAAKGTLLEKLGYSLHKASLQSDTSSEFQDRVGQSIAAYRKASRTHLACGHSAGALRCEAMVAYLAYSISRTIRERKRLLSKAWKLAIRSFETFQRQGNENALALTYNQLAPIAGLAYWLEWDTKTRLSLLNDAIEYGREAIKALSSKENPDELARAYTFTSAYLGLLPIHSELADKQDLVDQSEALWRKAFDASQTVAMLERAAQSRFSMIQPESEILGSDVAITADERILEYTRETGDRLLISSALDMLAYNLFYKATNIEDPEESHRLGARWLSLLDESRRVFSPLSVGLPSQSLFALAPGRPEYYWQTAKLERNESERRRRLETALAEVPDLLTESKASGITDALTNALHVASKVYASVATAEGNPERKKSLLRKAFWYRKRYNSLQAKTKGPGDLWNTGLGDNYLADIQAEYANLATRPRDKARLLSRAVRLKERSLKLCGADTFVLNWGSGGPSPYYGALGKYHLECGEMYRKLYDLDHNSEDLRRASEKFTLATELFQKIDLTIRMAEASLKAALAYEKINEDDRASESYVLASSSYKLAAQKIPSLSKFYEQLSLYMQARSQIAKARNHHRLGEYGLAKENYARAAQLQESSGQWKYLSSGLFALAQLEDAEDKSSRELCEEAVAAYSQAVRTFHKSRISIQTHLVDVDDPEDRREGEALTRTSNAHELYCKARADLEEARILDKNGNQRSAREKYDRGLESLQHIVQHFGEELGRDESNFIITLSKAWKSMGRAEAEASAELYETASSLFLKASDSCSSDNTKMLLAGHSRYCSSLNAVSQFIDKGRTSDYHTAVQKLQSAANHYLKSGFHSASEHSKGTKHLIEAHLYLNKANREVDQEKKVRLYSMVERLLKAAVESFSESGYVAKKRQVTSLLDKVRDEKELAISLSNDMAGPFTVPSGIFPSKVSGDVPVGVGRLQGAYVVANMFPSPTSLRLGESMSLKIELANAGANTAQLVRVERMVPEGFDLVKKPKELNLEQIQLILKGRRLEPSKTEEVSLTLKPNVLGALALRPRIFYLDESGRSRVHEPEPIEILVQDHGNVSQITSIASDDVIGRSPIIKFLVDAFVGDYMRRRVDIEHAGWRGLLDIVRSLRIPRSQVYGDARYKHTFGKPLERLVKSGMVEFRVFPGERGRGGNIIRIRVSYEKEPVKRFVDSLALTMPT